MKNLLLGIIIFSPSLYAENCMVPQNISGNRVLAENIQQYSPSNPMSGDIYEMHFHDNGKYDFISLSGNDRFTGEYQYNVFSSDTAEISATTSYGNSPVKYKMTIVCESNTSGYYIYKQAAGHGGKRANVSRYFVIGK